MTDPTGVVLARDDGKPLPTGVPILDYGVTLTRDGYSVVVLDGLGPDDMRREIAEICALLGAPIRNQRTEDD